MKNQRYNPQRYDSFEYKRSVANKYGSSAAFGKKSAFSPKRGSGIGFLYRYGTFLLFPLSYLFYELILHIVSGIPYFGASLLYIFFFSVSAGFLSALLVSISRIEKLNRILTVILLVVPAILFVTEYLLKGSYQVFMDFNSIFTGAGDVATNGFADTLFTTIVTGIGIIMVYLFPTIAYLIIGRKYISAEGQDLIPLGACAAACLVFFGIGRLSVQLSSVDSPKYKQEYNFHSATCNFGLFTSLRLDTTYAIFGGGSGGNDFVIEQPYEDPSDTENQGEEQPTDVPVEYGYNEMESIDFNALAENTSNETVKKMHQYVASQTPAKQNEYTGIFEGKNLIFISAEAFAAEVIDPQLTPTLYRLATKGIVFEDYYQPTWGGSTSTGEYSNLMGLVPTAGVDSMKKTIDHNLYFTIGNQLKRLNYNSFAYHNGSYTYYSRNKTHKNFGYDTFMGMGNGMEEGVRNCWPQSDKEMIDFTVSQYIDKQPFSVYYMTVSGHGLYTRQGNSMSTKNYSVVENMDASSYIKAYLACQLELEYALQSLLAQLETAGILEDTVIVMGTDHYPYCLEKSDSWNTDKNYLPELYGYDNIDDFNLVHSALIIWSGSLEQLEEPIVVSEPTYSLDILPTISNLFGVEYDSRMFAGRDVFSNEEALVIFSNYSWITSKGKYNSSTGEFIPAEGETVDEAYIERIKTKVRNKYNFSKNCLEYDYWGKIFG